MPVVCVTALPIPPIAKQGFDSSYPSSGGGTDPPCLSEIPPASRGPEPAGYSRASPNECQLRRLACSGLAVPALFEPQTELSLISQPYGRYPMQVSSGDKQARRPQQCHARINAGPRTTATTCREDDHILRRVQAEEAKGKVGFLRHFVICFTNPHGTCRPEAGSRTLTPPFFKTLAWLRCTSPHCVREHHVDFHCLFHSATKGSHAAIVPGGFRNQPASTSQAAGGLDPNYARKPARQRRSCSPGRR